MSLTVLERITNHQTSADFWKGLTLPRRLVTKEHAERVLSQPLTKASEFVMTPSPSQLGYWKLLEKAEELNGRSEFIIITREQVKELARIKPIHPWKSDCYINGNLRNLGMTLRAGNYHGADNVVEDIEQEPEPKLL